jgi:hypothetical protein
MKQIFIEKYIEPSEISVYTPTIDEMVYLYRSKYSIHRWFNKYGELHSYLGQPAEIHYNEIGCIYNQIWYKNGILHRERDQPAEIKYSTIDNVSFYTSSKFWDKKGKLHRDGDKPAIMFFDFKSGNVLEERWFKNGEPHRDDNEYVTIDYFNNGKIRKQYLKGEHLW